LQQPALAGYSLRKGDSEKHVPIRVRHNRESVQKPDHWTNVHALKLPSVSGDKDKIHPKASVHRSWFQEIPRGISEDGV